MALLFRNNGLMCTGRLLVPDWPPCIGVIVSQSLGNTLPGV